MLRLLFTCFILFFTTQSFTQTIFTYMGKEDTKDDRKNYNIALLKLALDKTVSMHGAYKLVPYAKMNHKRAEKTALEEQMNYLVNMNHIKILKTYTMILH